MTMMHLARPAARAVRVCRIPFLDRLREFHLTGGGFLANSESTDQALCERSPPPHPLHPRPSDGFVLDVLGKDDKTEFLHGSASGFRSLPELPDLPFVPLVLDVRRFVAQSM